MWLITMPEGLIGDRRSRAWNKADTAFPAQPYVYPTRGGVVSVRCSADAQYGTMPCDRWAVLSMVEHWKPLTVESSLVAPEATVLPSTAFNHRTVKGGSSALRRCREQIEGSFADQCRRKLEAAEDCGMVRVAKSGAAVIEFQPCRCQRCADLMLKSSMNLRRMWDE